MWGDGLQTYPLQGCVRSYAIVCSLLGFDPTSSSLLEQKGRKEGVAP